MSKNNSISSNASTNNNNAGLIVNNHDTNSNDVDHITKKQKLAQSNQVNTQEYYDNGNNNSYTINNGNPQQVPIPVPVHPQSTYYPNFARPIQAQVIPVYNNNNNATQQRTVPTPYGYNNYHHIHPNNLHFASPVLAHAS